MGFELEPPVPEKDALKLVEEAQAALKGEGLAIGVIDNVTGKLVISTHVKNNSNSSLDYEIK